MIEDAIEKLTILLQGKIPEKIGTEKIADESKHKLAVILNQLITFMQETQEFIIPLSRGKLDEIKLPPKNFLGSPFKELHSRLLHLIWQAKQVANGDYSQRVDFMGEFSEAINSMIISLDHNETLLKKKINELEKALVHITKLEGVLPICASCKQIRRKGSDPKKQASWVQIESYISEKTEAMFSHSICPKCMKKLYPNLIDGL